MVIIVDLICADDCWHSQIQFSRTLFFIFKVSFILVHLLIY